MASECASGGKRDFTLVFGSMWKIIYYETIWIFTIYLIFEPLEHALFFKIFEKTQGISLYWFAAQQQTSTYRRQKFDLFYQEFSAEFNKFSLKF